MVHDGDLLFGFTHARADTRPLSPGPFAARFGVGGVIRGPLSGMQQALTLALCLQKGPQSLAL